jgi:hypothetical protein
MAMFSFQGKPVLASEAKTVSTVVVTLTAAKYTKAGGNTASDLRKANSAFVTVEDQPVRISLDPAADAPTAATNGHEFAAGDSFLVEGHSAIVNLRAIRTGGTDGVLQVTYFE